LFPVSFMGQTDQAHCMALCVVVVEDFICN
jgi:hypothetical protein